MGRRATSRSKAPAILAVLLVGGGLGGWGLWKQSQRPDPDSPPLLVTPTSDEVEKIIARQKAEREAAKANKPEVSPGTAPPSTPPLAKPGLDSGAIGQTYTASLPGSVDLKLCYCPAGSFTMGSPESEADRSDDEKQVEITLTKPFWMAETEFTQGQWKAVMGTTPSEIKDAAGDEAFGDGNGIGPNYPMIYASWYDAVECIEMMNRKCALPKGWQWALPTEAQWEYACRGGTTSVFSFGDSISTADAATGDLRDAVPVRRYRPNAWGLYDMHGNVDEWCDDFYQEDWYLDNRRSRNDPAGPESAMTRVARGGSVGLPEKFLRSSSRESHRQHYHSDSVGFRPAAIPAGSR